MAAQNFAEFLGSLHRLTDITLDEVEDCFNGAGFTDEYCEAIVSNFKGKSEDEVRQEAMDRWQKENDEDIDEDVDEDVDEDAPSEPKTEVDEELSEKLHIFNTRLRNVFNINSNIALINDDA